MSDRVSMKVESPVVTWKNRFKDDFRFNPGRWMTGLSTALPGFFYKLVGKFPKRLYWWGKHITDGLAGLVKTPVSGSAGTLAANMGADAPAAQKPDSLPRRFGTWALLFLFRTLDLISFGEIVNLVTHLVKVNTRPLTALEIEEAKKVFGNSLDYWRVRIDEWSLIAHFGSWSYQRRQRKQQSKATNMAMTIYNTIHFSRRIKPEPGNGDMAWLIHELTHVAQCEHVGGVFMMEALIAQGKAGYSYGGPAGLVRRNLVDFNREQQGDIVKHYYQSLYGQKDLTDLERQDYERMIGQLQSGKL